MTGRVQSRGGGGEEGAAEEAGSKVTLQLRNVRSQRREKPAGLWGRAGEAAAAGTAESKALVKNKTRKEGRKQAERRRRGQWLKCKDGCGCLF